MVVRYRSAFGFLAVAVALAAATLTLAAQGLTPVSEAGSAPLAGVLERTPDGHPDFQGVWANNTVTPLQRPKQWEGKTVLTDAEVADLQKFAAQIVENDGDAQFGDGFILAVLNHVANPKSYPASGVAVGLICAGIGALAGGLWAALVNIGMLPIQVSVMRRDERPVARRRTAVGE